MKSKLFSLKLIDFIKGLITASLGAAFTTLIAAISIITDFATFEFKTLLYAFGVGFLGGLSGYVQKQFFSNSKGDPFKKEN